jgi:hypothetical protein
MMRTNIPPLEVDVNDGNWHGHNGGRMPLGLHGKSIVDLRWEQTSNGNNGVCASAGWKWSLVCAYRVTKVHVEPPKPCEFWVNVQYSVVLTSPPLRGNQLDYTHVREVLADD